MKSIPASSLAICAAILAGAAIIAHAGPLNPPAGPVAPTMKTLAEVEPRVPINSANTPGDGDSLFRITQPGSYYLTGNVTGVSGKSGIEVAASGVTVDLAGFTLSGVPGSFAGIISGQTGLAVRNGTVSGWGAAGVQSIAWSRITDVTSRNNGAGGIIVGPSSIVTGCNAVQNTQAGFLTLGNCTLENCAAGGNADGFIVGDGTAVSNCSAASNSASGFLTNGDGASFSGCTGTSNGTTGFNVFRGAKVVNCTASRNTADGITASAACSIQDCVCDSNGFNAGDGAGIRITGDGCRVEGNIVNSNDRGIDLDAVGNLVIGNSLRGQATTITGLAGNFVGQFSTNPNTAAHSFVNFSLAP